MNERDLEGLVQEIARGNITRRQFLYRAAQLGIGASAIAAVLAACGKSTTASSAPNPTPTTTVIPKQMFLFNWSDYLAPQVQSEFEKKYNLKIVQTYFDSNESLLAKLEAGAVGYDVIVPSDYMVHIMIKSGILEPLDMKLIPNFKNVMSEFQKPAYDNPDQNGGLKYSVPWQWGTTGIGVRTDKVSQQITKWADLWNNQYKGQVDMLSDERETPGAALKKLGFSLNSTDQNQLNQATQALIQQKPLVRQYDSINMKRNLIAGLPLVHTWNGDCLLAMQAVGTNKVSYVLPQEGSTVWADNLAIPKGAPNTYVGHLWMNFICDPKIAAQLVNYIEYLSPNEAAKPYIDKFIVDHTPSAQDLKRGEVINDVGAFAAQYTAAWTQVQSA